MTPPMVANSFDPAVSTEMYFNRRSWRMRAMSAPRSAVDAMMEDVRRWATQTVLWEFSLGDRVHIYFFNPDDALVWDLLQ